VNLNRFFAALIKLFSILPLCVVQFFGLLIGFFLSVLPNSVEEITRLNINKSFPGLSIKQKKNLTRNSIMHTVITALEMPKIFMATPDKVFSYIKHVYGMEAAIKDFGSGSAVLFIGPHFGCWEAAGLQVSNNFPVHTLYTAPDFKAFDVLVEKSRSRSGAVMSEANTKGVMMMFRALKDKKCVAILADQVPSLKAGVYAPFFNIPSFTMSLVAKMYLKCDPKVYVTYGIRNGIGKGFDVHYIALQKYIDMYQSESGFTMEKKFIYAMNKCFESVILTAPAQYEWSYKKFKEQPRCMLDPYRKEQ